MGGFSDDLNRFAAVTGAKADALVDEVVAEMAARLIERSPPGVAEGWKVGSDGGNPSVVNVLPEAPAAEFGRAGALPAAMVGLAVAEFPGVVEVSLFQLNRRMAPRNSSGGRLPAASVDDRRSSTDVNAKRLRP